MESFPEDLLVGVFPLVFAINATQPPGISNDASAPRRSKFEKFLDAMAASLLDDGDASVESANDSRRSISLFKPDEDEYSSDDEDFDDGSSRRRKSGGLYPGFGRNRQSSSSPHNSTVGGGGANSYAKALSMGQSFFERARIESFGTSHGFPPSKDPEGNKNLVHGIANALKERDSSKLKELFRKHPINGILPAGWLEKHVHALPSVILVVCTVTSTSQEQVEHDKYLFETIEHLAYSLANKRKCMIQVVGLLDDDVTDAQGIGWSEAITQRVHDSDGPDQEDSSVEVRMLRSAEDLEALDAGLPPGPNLKELHDAVRTSSYLYYLSEARRTKEKLAKITDEKRRRGADTTPDQILPLVIRYCVKIAFFYEFQLKHEKSLRYLAEAYRHVCRYYLYLRSNPKSIEQTDATNLTDIATPPTSVSNVTHDGVEVELDMINNPKKSIVWGNAVPPPPADMIHQCKAVAEWLNLKLLSAGFSSKTESGFIAATTQWREHQKAFCGPESGLSIPEWLAWSFVSRQRLVLCQLVERHPPSSCFDLDAENDELLALCSPWRTSLSAAESLLRLAREIDRTRDSLGDELETPPESDSDKLRDPFIGTLDSGGLTTILREECRTSHRQKALELVLKATSLFEGELRKEKRGFYAEDSFRESSSSRSGARMYYLAGGILLGMNRHEEAVPHLQKASKYAKGWRDLELSIRKMLIGCYEKHVPTHSDPMANESSQALASMILDSYFNAEMTSDDLRKALGQFSKISGGGALKWYRESFNDEDPDLPFTFEVTFPENIFATIGDTVKATISVKSNLDYAVHINSVVLLSLAGELPITSSDLMRAANVSEGSDGGIIIQRKFEITITTKLVLPKDLKFIASDDSGNGGEQQGVAGKGSFSKSARPRSAGLTSAGGARLLSADQLPKENKVTQGWSLRFLGGKPLKCDGIRLSFYPVQVGASGGGEQVPVIELTIDKKKPRTAANIKRTPFEEENYIASAWSRPLRLPLSCGPRSLRVLGPQPQMVITNITEPLTDGKSLEGTVNRVLLKLQSGPGEHCTNISYNVSCFSVFITPDGTTKRLVPEQELSSEAETSVHMKNPKYRTPVLVSENPTSDTEEPIDYGYTLPAGWKLSGDEGRGLNGKLRVLKGGDASYIQLDLFRPSATMQAGAEAEEINASMCKTDFYVTVSYRQERPSVRTRPSRGGRGRGADRGGAGKGRGRGRGRGRSFVSTSEEFSAASEDQSDETSGVPDDVTLEYSGTVVWSRPMEASFIPGLGANQPCGIIHPSTKIDHSGDESDIEFIAVDGGKVAAKCTLHTQNASEELCTEIVGIDFEPTEEACDLKVELSESSRNDGKCELYKSSIEDRCSVLSVGSKLSVAYTVDVNLSNDETMARANLGALKVNWMPFPLKLPDDVTSHSIKRFNGHGPLRLLKPSTVRFLGPSCEVQRAPFKADVSVHPTSPRVATPFEVHYEIENLTNFHQTLELAMTDPSGCNDSGLLFSGLINGKLVLGPNEKQILAYSVVAVRAGKAVLPPLSASSNRYRTWVVHDTGDKHSPLYIFP